MCPKLGHATLYHISVKNNMKKSELYKHFQNKLLSRATDFAPLLPRTPPPKWFFFAEIRVL